MNDRLFGFIPIPSLATLLFLDGVFLFLFAGTLILALRRGLDSGRQRVLLFRIVSVCTILFALFYIVWRYLASLNTEALWFAIPLVVAETYAFVDTILFASTMWKPTARTAPPPLEEAAVDVYITTYNEPVELVRMTAEAATRIDWPGIRVYILDDGNRGEFREMAETIGCDYITRGAEWDGKPRHAKAGNVNNAIARTSGDFILILDADQIPRPAIVKRIIGYFRDEKMAFVQTPQHFYNTPPGDPFGTDAPLFYGPILRGKDGWNAAFFCGSNALLRREALLQIGIMDYVDSTIGTVRDVLKAMEKEIGACSPVSRVEKDARSALLAAIREARKSVGTEHPLQDVLSGVRAAFSEAQTRVSGNAPSPNGPPSEGGNGALFCAASRLSAMISEYRKRLDMTRPDEAIPVLPISTESVTEDMATSIRLHSKGWKSAFHPEILAQGLAPEDLASALGQRLRWAQGTIQVLLKSNPLTVPGLSTAQRIQYYATIHSYFSGFAALIFILSPLVYLFFGIAPVRAYNPEFMWRLLPYLVFNRVMFRIAAAGIDVRRGEQYALSLFPVWIKAVVSVLVGKRPRFVVTPKYRQAGIHLSLVRIQLLCLALSLVGTGTGIWTWARNGPITPTGFAINAFWALYNAFFLMTIVRAAFYRIPKGWKPEPPAYATQKLDR